MQTLKLTILLLTVIAISSCNKDEDNSKMENFKHLEGYVLEITNRALVDSGESDIFNVYVSAVKFNSNQTIELLDDNYGQSESWSMAHSDMFWEQRNDTILINLNDNRVTKWPIISIKNEGIEVQETTDHDGVTSQHTMKISTKQEIKKSI